MATLYKRKGSTVWQVEITGADGKRLQRSTGTRDRKAAQEYAVRLEGEIWRQAKLKDRPRRSWQDAVVRWVGEHAAKRSLEEDKKALRWLDGHLGHLMLDAIDRRQIDAIRQAKAETAKPETVNRTLAVLRAILNQAAGEWEWIDAAPTVKLMKCETKRLRWLTHEEAARLIRELPDHLGEMVRFSLATGLRESNVTGLTWGQVDLARQCAWVHADQAKGKKPFSVPLNKDAIACLRRQIGKHGEFVFVYDGKPVNRGNTAAWRKALQRAGIREFRWHDLRHTWASWHIQAGTPPEVLKALGGWSSLAMVEKYAHLNPAHLAEYAGNSERVVTVSLTVVK